MNISIRSLLAIVTLSAIAACAARPLQPGPEAGLSPEGLQRMTGTTFDEVWLRPGVDTARYSRVVLEPVSVSYRDTGERKAERVQLGSLIDRRQIRDDGFPIPARERARIEETLERRLADALDGSERYQRVAEPGPGTLELHATLVDYVSRVPHEAPLTDVYVNSVGQATLVLELWDSEQRELLARAQKHSQAGPRGNRLIRANEVTGWPEVDVQMQRWGRDARALLDEIYRMHDTG